MDDNVALHIDSKGIRVDPYCFPRSYVNFQVTRRAEKCLIWLDLSDSCLFTLVWIYRWQWNTTHSSQKNNKGSDIFTRSSVNFQGYTGRKKGPTWPSIWAFPDDNFTLNLWMAMTLYILRTLKRNRVVFRGHQSNPENKNWFAPKLSVSELVMLRIVCDREGL